jgi:HPt (histidine-containing phosphotransfer) domain-containing protein
MDPDSRAHADFPETDPQALERLRRFGGEKLLGNMIILFLDAVPRRLAAARLGLAQGDGPAVEHELHALKSSAAQLGALRMHRLSQQGEQLARAGTLDALDPILRELDAEAPRVREWLDGVQARSIE